MAEANRAERHAWVERRAAAPRNPEAPKYLGFQVIKAEPCPGLLGDVVLGALLPYRSLSPEPRWRGRSLFIEYFIDLAHNKSYYFDKSYYRISDLFLFLETQLIHIAFGLEYKNLKCL